MSLLTTSTVAEYCQDALKGVDGLPLDLSAPLQVREIVGGNLNYAFCVHEAAQPSRAVFVKQAPEFIKCLGPDFALAAKRIVLESEVMREYQRLAPAHAPRHFLLDEARFVLVLQYLDGYTLLREELLAGKVATRVAAELGAFMGLTHRKTHATMLTDEERFETMPEQRFANEMMCGITADYVFTKPMAADDPTNRCSDALAPHAAALRKDGELKEAMLAMRSVFQTRRECLVHGDLHTGSIMVPAAAAAAALGTKPVDAPAVVIDAEFAFYGPAAFDAGVLFANLLFAAIRHGVLGAPGVQAALLESIYDCWNTYVGVLMTPAASAGPHDKAPKRPHPQLDAEEAILQLLHETAGFCGCELVRRVVGAAHVDDLESIAEPRQKLRAERVALCLGAMLLKGRAELEDIGGLLEKAAEAEQRVAGGQQGAY